jgi:hypothetical protein
LTPWTALIYMRAPTGGRDGRLFAFSEHFRTFTEE